jgi:DNA-binding CsgD family transcriptional regulator
MMPAGPASASPLLERERELDAFDRLLGDVAGGRSGFVVIEGSAGIGKSCLLAALRDRAAGKGLRVVAAHGSELEREFAFGVVRQLFESALTEPADRGRLLAGGAAPAHAVFEPVASDGADVSFAVLHGLYWLTVNLASERPLLLAVDELHWCDRPSMRFLAYLVRRLEGLGAALAVGLRSAELGVAPVLIGELAEAPDAVRLRPRPLSEAGVAELIRSRLGVEPDPAFTAACVSGTGGNPLLLRQLLSSLEADGVTPEARHARAVQQVGPRAVSRTVLLRLHRLPDPAAAVAEAIAVLGDGAELPVVAELTGLEEPAVADATAALARAEILRPQPPLGFVHPLVRDAAYHNLPPGERELRHAEAARLLRQAGAPAEEVATHLLACPKRGQEWVVDVLREAARSARNRGAADSAAAYLERALVEPPAARGRTRVILELGLAETLTHGPAAALHLREVWGTLEDPRERAPVAVALARTLIFTGPAAEAVAFVRRAATELPVELVDERQALRAIELMAIPLGAADDETLGTLERLRIEGMGPGARMLAAAAAEGRALTGASADECVALATRALADGVLIDADPGFLRNAAPWVLVMADRAEARRAWQEMQAHAHRRGSLFGFLGTNLWTGASQLWWGDLREAESTLLTALENAAAWGLLRSGAAYGPALAFAGAVRVLRGDLEGARRLLDPAEGDERRVDSSRLTLRSRVDLLLAEGRHEEALAAADELAERFGAIVNPGWAPWRSLKAGALDRLGRSEEAIALAGEELVHARRFGSPSVVGRSLRVLGTLERERGIDRLLEAVELLERSTAKLELGFAQFALGAALRRLRKPSEAREPLRRALELADRCGAERLAAQARAELYASGGRPRRTALSGVASLTASERRVAELAAEGRTNKDIAQTLYVTLKTVERHLSSAYGKLGIGSKRELSQALAHSGPSPRLRPKP